MADTWDGSDAERVDKPPSAPAGTRWRVRRLLRYVLIALVIVAVSPTVFILAYRVIDPPVTPLMLIRLGDGEGIEKHWRELDDLSPHLARAVIASEDNLFCRHNGFDLKALKEQLEAWQDGAPVRGASTISMQTAKNILLWPKRNLFRKGIEAWMTLQIELIWPKTRILEVYLNIIETGPGRYGAEAAAMAAFGKSALHLTTREAALIAVTLPNPRQRSAANPSPSLRRLAHTIQARVKQLGPLLDCVP